jgi:hypothetical protein
MIINIKELRIQMLFFNFDDVQSRLCDMTNSVQVLNQIDFCIIL